MVKKPQMLRGHLSFSLSSISFCLLLVDKINQSRSTYKFGGDVVNLMGF